jgi:hypothetical protein
MPYTTHADRLRLNRIVESIADEIVPHATKGDLNFLLSTLVGEYVIKKGLGYSSINDVMGALVGCLLEFYRRIAVPYEKKKIEINGDVDQYRILTTMIESLKA